MTIEDLRKYRRILILGYGIEGKETELFLKKHLPESQIIVADRSEGSDYLKKQEDVDLVIKTPSIPPKLVTKPYTTATNIFFANVDSTLVGITGTKGKSTTSSLIYHILKKAGKSVYLAGNIGIPMLSLIDKVSSVDIVVLELSSYQLQDIEYSPHIGVILNIYTDLHNHESFSAYQQVKMKIVAKSNATDYFVYNPAFPELTTIETRAKKIPLDSTNNDEDVKAAEIICQLLGVDSGAIEQGIQSFQPLPHRNQKIGTYNEIIFIDDSASTHPESTIKALRELGKVDTLICGGQNRDFELDELAHEIIASSVENVVLFPDTGNLLERSLLLSPKKAMRIFKTDSMELAVKFALAKTKPGNVCLLSPGAPSYLTFKNFEERGDKFVYYLDKYAKKKEGTTESSQDQQ